MGKSRYNQIQHQFLVWRPLSSFQTKEWRQFRAMFKESISSKVLLDFCFGNHNMLNINVVTKTTAAMEYCKKHFRENVTFRSCYHAVKGELVLCLHLIMSSYLVFNKFYPFYEVLSNFPWRHITFSFGYVERCPFPYCSPGDFWCEKIVFY